ncbi:MAG: hypothetical protein LBQ91_01730 [Oscillospiraceae bacterium]|jgi:hypothetical protein|nr:hypothetical protein [Oscillospiraceae bacterium]
MKHIARLIFAAAFAITLLSGCGSGAPGSVPTDTPTATATPTAEVTAEQTPEQLPVLTADVLRKSATQYGDLVLEGYRIESFEPFSELVPILRLTIGNCLISDGLTLPGYECLDGLEYIWLFDNSGADPFSVISPFLRTSEVKEFYIVEHGSPARSWDLSVLTEMSALESCGIVTDCRLELEPLLAFPGMGIHVSKTTVNELTVDERRKFYLTEQQNASDWNLMDENLNVLGDMNSEFQDLPGDRPFLMYSRG